MSDVDPNSIKAGEYELVALRWDEVTSKPGEPFDFVRHRKGDKVKLDVEQARRLVIAGAVVKPGKAGEVEVPGQGPSVAPGEGDEPAQSVDLGNVVGASVGSYDPGAEGQTEAKVLEYVGTDVDLAAAVLEQERAGKNRAGVVSKLEALATPVS